MLTTAVIAPVGYAAFGAIQGTDTPPVDGRNAATATATPTVSPQQLDDAKVAIDAFGAGPDGRDIFGSMRVTETGALEVFRKPDAAAVDSFDRAIRRLAGPVDVIVRDSAFSYRELHDLMMDIFDDRGQLEREAGIRVTGVMPREDASGVRIEIDEQPDPVAVAELRRRYGPVDAVYSEGFVNGTPGATTPPPGAPTRSGD